MSSRRTRTKKRGAAGVAVAVLLCSSVAAEAADVRLGWQDQRAALHPEDAYLAFGAARMISARSMRLIVLWDDVQPSRGMWRWESYDRAIGAARAHGFTVHLTLGGVGRSPPAWAAGGAPADPNGSAAAWSRIDERAFHAFVKAAARRYARRVKLWTILNEADISGYPAESYARLFTLTRNSIRRLAPGSRVLWGDFAPASPLSYTRAALTGTHRRTVADGFAWHPYPNAIVPRTEGALERTGRLASRVQSWSRRSRKALTTPGGAALPLYATEFGCHADNHDEHECERQWISAITVARRYRLRRLVAYQLLPGSQSWNTSIVRRDGSPSRAMSYLRANGTSEE